MKQVQPHHQEGTLAGIPLISLKHSPLTVDIYAMVHIPHGYEFHQITYDDGISPPEYHIELLPGSAGSSVETHLLGSAAYDLQKPTSLVKVTGGPLDSAKTEVLVNHQNAPGTTPLHSTENQPFAFVQKLSGQGKRAVHYCAWLPSSCSLNITNAAPSAGVPWTHTLDVSEDNPAISEMTFFRNCIWINETDHTDWPEVTIEVKRGGNTKKVMVSTNDGSVGTKGDAGI